MAITRYIDIKVRSKGAQKNVNKLSKDVRGLGSDAETTSKFIGNMTKAAIGVGIALAARNIIKYADAFTSVQNQIIQTTKTTKELTDVTSALFDVSNRSRVGIEATASLYTQLTLSTTELNLSTAETLRLTETISKSFAISGQTAAESAGAIRQLGQAFAAGALRGDEFNSIAEGAPEIMRALQRSLQMTQGELRAFAATGGITAEILVTALSGAASVIDEKLTKATRTYAQSVELANNNMIEFIGSSKLVKGAVGAAGDALISASNNLENIADISILLASVYAARLIPAITTYTAGIITNSVALITQNKAHIKVGLSATLTSAAMARATISIRAMTIASRAATGALALLGGPVGAAVVAATAIFLYTSRVDDAGQSSTLTASDVDRLSKSFDGLSDNLKRTEIAKINDEMALVRAELIATSKTVEFFKKQAEGLIGRDRSDVLGMIKDQEAAVIDLNDQLDLLSQKQGLIFSDPTKGFTDRKEEPEKEKKDSPFLLRLSQETLALKTELELRRQVEAGFLSQHDADLFARFSSDKARKEAAFAVELAKLSEDEEARKELKFLFNEQQILARQVFEESLTGIEQTESDKRISIAEQEAMEKQGFMDSLFGSSISFGASMLKLNISNNAKSEKEKKKARKKGVIIDTAAGIARAYAEQNFYVASGMAVALAANGITQIANINSASGISTGGGSSGATQPAITRDFQPDVSTESTALTELANELRNRDPDEPLSVGFVRRLVASVDDARGTGQI